MDGSFLSNAAVVKASRNFVCIRLATYEDKEEAKFLESIFTGRSGKLENTVFVILSPDAKKFLCRPGRSPRFAYRNASAMATAMKKIAKKYPGKEVSNKKKHDTLLPKMKDVRLAMNVASCDGLPLVIAYAESERQLATSVRQLSQLAFDKQLAGKFIYATTSNKEDLKNIKNFKNFKPSEFGIVIVSPGQFGLDGKMVTSIKKNVDAKTLRTTLVKTAKKLSKISKDHRSHVRQGFRLKIDWKTAVPVTDPMSKQRYQQRNLPR